MLRLPVFAHFEVTDACNLRCRHCFRLNVSDVPESQDLDDDVTLGVVRLLIENGIYSLTLTGGEPFARPEVTLKALEIAKNAGLHVTINSNILLLTPSIVSELKRLRVDSLLVSCPAGNEEVYRQITRFGCYDVFKENVEALVAANFSFLVNMVVSQANFHLMRNTAMEMAALGVRNFALTPASLNIKYPAYDQLLSIHQIHQLFETLLWCRQTLGLHVDSVEALPKCFYPDWCFEGKNPLSRRTCLAGSKSVSISNTGEVRPCAHNPKSYGNVFTESLEAIYERMGEYRNNVIPEMCGDCQTVSECRGACRIYSIAKHGVLDKPDRLTRDPIPLRQKAKFEIAIDDDTVFHFNGRLRSRPELEGHFSIASMENSNNLLVVNESLFRFVRWLSESLPLSFAQIRSHGKEGSKREAQAGILASLVRNRFICIAGSQSS